MPFIPHTKEEVQQMLDTIGVDSIDQLFDEIKVFETDSFGDAEHFTYSILGLDDSTKEISVVRYDDITISELEKN